MAKGLDIRRRIRSVKNTKAITKAMEMVAASKMRKAQEAALRSRSYAEKALEILSTVSGLIPENHPFLAGHRRAGGEKGKRYLILAISPNKGLCGSLTTNLMRSIATFVQENEAATSDGQRAMGNTSQASRSAPSPQPVASFDFVTLGKRGRDALLRMHYGIASDYSDLGDSVGVSDLGPLAKEVLGGFEQGKYDGVYAVYTHFSSVLVQKAVLKRILPLGRDMADMLALTNKEYHQGTEKEPTEILFEPSPEAVLSQLIPRLTEMQIFQAVLEAQASEQSARMVAMQNATKAAGELIDDLTLTYNKARQAAITQEISEIVGGVEALKQ